MRRNKNIAPAAIKFTSARNDDGHSQLCVYARCIFSERTVGPIWGHKEASVKRALAQLTTHCDCPARYHKASEYSGHRVTLEEPKKSI